MRSETWRKPSCQRCCWRSQVWVSAGSSPGTATLVRNTAAPALDPAAIGEVEVLGDRVALPAAAGLDRGALPDAAGAVERQRMAGPVARRLLDAEMGVERHHLHLGERVLVRIEEIEARLHESGLRARPRTRACSGAGNPRAARSRRRRSRRNRAASAASPRAARHPCSPIGRCAAAPRCRSPAGAARRRRCARSRPSRRCCRRGSGCAACRAASRAVPRPRRRAARPAPR